MSNTTCRTCKTVKPDAEFYKSNGKIRPYCKPCWKLRAAKYYICNQPAVRISNSSYLGLPGHIEKQRQRVRNWHYKKHYGMSESDKRKLEAAQGHRCAICKTHFSEIDQRSVHVDHDHSTGAIRGILCHHCNQVLGQSRDNPSVLLAAIDYLAVHSVLPEPYSV